MAGATYLVSKESLDAGKYKWEEVIGPPAVSTTTREIFDSIQADTVVIKIDVEGHECKALLPEILDQSTGKFVPYIFMEVSHEQFFSLSPVVSCNCAYSLVGKPASQSSPHL